MTDFHNLFMVKINKMIRKKTEGIFLVVHVINIFMVALCIQIATKLCLVYSPDCRVHTFMHLLKGNFKCKLVLPQGVLCLLHHVLDNQNSLVFVCFVQFSNQLDVHNFTE